VDERLDLPAEARASASGGTRCARRHEVQPHGGVWGDFSAIRERVNQDLESKGMRREKVLATSSTWSRTAIRVGNEE